VEAEDARARLAQERAACEEQTRQLAAQRQALEAREAQVEEAGRAAQEATSRATQREEELREREDKVAKQQAENEKAKANLFMRQRDADDALKLIKKKHEAIRAEREALERLRAQKPTGAAKPAGATFPEASEIPISAADLIDDDVPLLDDTELVELDPKGNGGA